jgi:crotonobetainyl-CoA:carnitine CoA-transferase CaiB-like acyl-CoA transferase
VSGAGPGAPARRPALAGLRVVEFTAAMAGPWIGRFLAWCGAEVIRVESKQRPDVVRLYVPPRARELGTQERLSPWFTDWNAGKRFVALDLTRPKAVELARRLVAKSDVVIENYATGVMRKLGLDYEALRGVRPDLVMLSTSGLGDSGPRAQWVTWGPNIEALSGLARLSGFPGRECTITQFAHPDVASALHGLVAVLCALDRRRRTGEGCYVTLSQLEATIASFGQVLLESLANGREPAKRGNRSPHAAPHGVYRCLGEDRWVAIAVEDEGAWRRLCEAAGRPDWAADPRFATLAARHAHEDALDAELASWTSGQEAYAVMDRLQAAGVAAGVVQDVRDQLERDPQLRARGHFESLPHLAKGRVVANGVPLGLTGTPGASGPSGAAVGEHNEEVFRGLLGLDEAEYRAAVADGAIEEPG